MDEKKAKKHLIFYARAYRRLAAVSKPMWICFALTVVPTIVLLLLYYSPLTLALTNWAGHIVTAATGETVGVAHSDYLPSFGPIYFFEMQGTTPSFGFSLANFIGAMLLLLIFSQAKKNARSVMIYVCMGLVVHMISSLFFLIMPDQFPYSFTQYAQLYMSQQIAIWLFITLIAGLETLLIDASIRAKLLAFFTTIAYIFVYGCVRYVVYFVLLHYWTAIFMATFFFIFGVLFDFMQMVSVFSVFLVSVSKRQQIGKVRERWLWS